MKPIYNLLDLLSALTGLAMLTIFGTGLAFVSVMVSLYLFNYDMWLYVVLPDHDWARLHLGLVAMICAYLSGLLAYRALATLTAKRRSYAFLTRTHRPKVTLYKRIFKGQTHNGIIVR